MVTTTVESLYDNSLMTKLYDIMQSLVVMEELLGNDKVGSRIEVWRDSHGCMISYLSKEETPNSPFYKIRAFYRYDTKKIAVQFLEDDFKIIAERDLNDYEFQSLSWHKPGERNIRFFVGLEDLQIFLHRLVDNQ